MRVRCHYCRRGVVRLTSLAWRYGAHATIARLVALFARRRHGITTTLNASPRNTVRIAALIAPILECAPASRQDQAADLTVSRAC